jgi:predicted transcriptional regulator
MASLTVRISTELNAVVHRLANRRRVKDPEVIRLSIELYNFIAEKLDEDKEFYLYDIKSNSYVVVDLSRF